MKVGKVCRYRPPYHGEKAGPSMTCANKQKQKCFNAKTLHVVRQCGEIKHVSDSSGGSVPGRLLDNRLHDGPFTGFSVFGCESSKVGGALAKDDRNASQGRNGGY